jgi:2-haloacid dehalogenase
VIKTPEIMAFDVYGTLVDPLALDVVLAGYVSVDLAAAAALLWRTKQIEYAFRRTAMGAYADFTVCTRQALRFTFTALGLSPTPEIESTLLDAYASLPPFPDAVAALMDLRVVGIPLVAFSNGTDAAVRTVLAHAGILPLLDDVISVDPVRAFKPAPVVYRHLATSRGCAPSDVMLVSSNGWDAIGALNAGLRAIWIQRDPNAVFDPWGFEPEAILADLTSLSARFALNR